MLQNTARQIKESEQAPQFNSVVEFRGKIIATCVSPELAEKIAELLNYYMRPVPPPQDMMNNQNTGY